MRQRLPLGVGLACLVIQCLVTPAGAHPGGLDAQGCHTVRNDYTYANGRVVKAGERHCHRLLEKGGLTLDGREVLQEKPHDHRSTHERCTDEPYHRDCAEFWGPY